MNDYIKYKLIGGLVTTILFLFSFQYAANAVLVTVKCTTATVNTIKNSTGVDLAKDAFVQIIQSIDPSAGAPLKNGTPAGDTAVNLTVVNKLQSPGNFESAVDMSAGAYVYIRAWESWDGIGLPHGKYGTSKPEQISQVAYGYVYQPVTTDWKTDVDIFSVTLTAPNGGEYLAGGSSKTILWTKGLTEPDHWKLEYSIDGGKAWNPINDNVAGNALSFSWNPIPLKNSGSNPGEPKDAGGIGCLVRIQAIDGDAKSQATDKSDSVFTIDSTAPSKPTNLAVVPYQQWTNTDSYNLSWKDPNLLDISTIKDSHYKIGLVAPANPTDGSSGLNYKKDGATVSEFKLGTGKYNFYVWLTDQAGNSDFNNYETLENAIWFDNTAPVFTGDVTPDPTIASPTSESTFIFNWPVATDDHSGFSNKYYYLFDTNKNTSAQTVRTNALSVKTDKTTATVAANSSNTWYLHVVAEDDVTDGIGNLTELTSAGITVDITKPKVLSFAPSGTGVSPTAPIVIAFDDDMLPNVKYFTYSLDPPSSNYTLIWTSPNKMTITHDPFNFSTPYTFTITAAKDKVGWDFFGTKIFNFTTGIPGLPTLFSDARALADPDSKKITLRWTNQKVNFTGGRVVYTTKNDLWDGLKPTGNVVDATIKTLDLPAANNVDSDFSGGTKKVLDDIFTVTDTIYFKIFPYYTAPGGTFYNVDAEKGTGVKIAAMPQKDTAAAAVAVPLSYTLYGPKNGKLFGINTFGVPFSSPSVSTPIIGPNGTKFDSSFTVNDLIKEINLKAKEVRVNVFGYYDSSSPKFVGLTKIVYAGNEIDTAPNKTLATAGNDVAKIIAQSISSTEVYQVTLSAKTNAENLNDISFNITGYYPQ